MAKFQLVECRQCHVRDIDRNKDPDGETWIMPSKNWYYHRKCYENWKRSTPETDEEYRKFIYDFIARDLKVSYNYHMCNAQINKFVKENGFTVKGIFFTLKYFYQIKGGDWNKGNGGIGIVPFVYKEACTYWYEQEKRTAGITEQIVLQMREAAKTQKKVVVQKKAKQKFVVDLDAIMAMEDEE